MRSWLQFTIHYCYLLELQHSDNRTILTTLPGSALRHHQIRTVSWGWWWWLFSRQKFHKQRLCVRLWHVRWCTIYSAGKKSLDHARYQAYFHNLIHLKILTNTKVQTNWLYTITGYLWITLLQLLYTNNANILCSVHWQQSLQHIASVSNVPGIGQFPLEWPVVQLPQSIQTTWLASLYLPEEDFPQMFYGIQVCALGWPLQDLDVLDEAGHFVCLIARSMVLLEDNCFSLTIKWRSWRQYVVPQHLHILVLLHGAFTLVELDAITRPPHMDSQTIREPTPRFTVWRFALCGVALTNPPSHNSLLCPTKKLKRTLIRQ